MNSKWVSSEWIGVVAVVGGVHSCWGCAVSTPLDGWPIDGDEWGGEEGAKCSGGILSSGMWVMGR